MSETRVDAFIPKVKVDSTYDIDKDGAGAQTIDFSVIQNDAISTANNVITKTDN